MLFWHCVLWNTESWKFCIRFVVYILQILQLIHSYTTSTCKSSEMLSCVYPSNFAIDTFLYNNTTITMLAVASCVYPSNFAIDTFLYNHLCFIVVLICVVYILQILQLIHSYTTMRVLLLIAQQVVYILQILQLIHSYTTDTQTQTRPKTLCISFKFCNWYIPIQLDFAAKVAKSGCVYPSNFAIDTFLYNKSWI